MARRVRVVFTARLFPHSLYFLVLFLLRRFLPRTLCSFFATFRFVPVTSAFTPCPRSPCLWWGLGVVAVVVVGFPGGALSFFFCVAFHEFPSASFSFFLRHPRVPRACLLGASLTLPRTASGPHAAFRLIQNRQRAAMRWRDGLGSFSPRDCSLTFYYFSLCSFCLGLHSTSLSLL